MENDGVRTLIKMCGDHNFVQIEYIWNGLTSATYEQGIGDSPPKVDRISSKFTSMAMHEFGNSTSSTSLETMHL